MAKGYDWSVNVEVCCPVRRGARRARRVCQNHVVEGWSATKGKVGKRDAEQDVRDQWRRHNPTCRVTIWEKPKYNIKTKLKGPSKRGKTKITRHGLRGMKRKLAAPKTPGEYVDPFLEELIEETPSLADKDRDEQLEALVFDLLNPTSTKSYAQMEKEAEEEAAANPPVREAPPPLPEYGPGQTPRSAFKNNPVSYFRQDWVEDWAGDQMIREGESSTLVLENTTLPASDFADPKLEHGNAIGRSPRAEYEDSVLRWSRGEPPVYRERRRDGTWTKPFHPLNKRGDRVQINVGQDGSAGTPKNQRAVLGEGNHRTDAIRSLLRKGKIDPNHPIPVTLTYYGLAVEDPKAWIPRSKRKK